MAATKPGVLFVLLLYIVKIHLVIAQAIPGACGACTGYGFCGGIYPTVLDTSNADPLDIILPVLLLALCKKMGAAAAAEEAAAASSANALPCPANTNGCNACCCSGSQCCQPYNPCVGGNSAGSCACASSNNGCVSPCTANPCGGCCADTGFTGGCGGCPSPISGNCACVCY